MLDKVAIDLQTANSHQLSDSFNMRQKNKALRMTATKQSEKHLSRAMFMLTSLMCIIAAVLFVPPLRDRFFSTKLFPWSLPWDTTVDDLEMLKKISKPGDIIIESNLHGWQWICLCFATTGTTWVHAALVDENQRILTVEKRVIETDFDIYLHWGSTKLALLRPQYQDDDQIASVLAYARNKLNTPYDPSFTDHAGNCNGLVASSLVHCGFEVPLTKCLGKNIYAPDCFLKIPGIETVWKSSLTATRTKKVGQTC